ncbi:MAG: hypothetical protein GW769_16270 [Alphaproteobacteria bacterium]|nr:hypothetical protein [Alphaproteobacteria bacterium]
MTFKVMLTAIPLFFTLGFTVAALGGLDLLTNITMSGEPPAPAIGEAIAGLSTGSILIAVLINGIALLLPLLATMAMMVAIIRSIVFNEKLDRSILSKLCNKTVLRVFVTEIIIGLLFLVIGAILIGITSLAFASVLQGLFFSFMIMVPVFIYLLLRVSLIPIGVAVGDIQSVSEALPKTKGQIFNVFKVFVLSFLISMGLQLLIRLSTLTMTMEGTGMMMIGAILLLVVFVIIVPFYQIGNTALSHLYKKIR